MQVANEDRAHLMKVLGEQNKQIERLMDDADAAKRKQHGTQHL